MIIRRPVLALGCALAALVIGSNVLGAAARPAHLAAAPKTPFQCEKAFHTSQGRERCFNRLPGSSCAHPLEVQKAGDTVRGAAARYFTLNFSEEPDATINTGATQHYSWAPKKNVAICPYPIGAVYKVSLLSTTNRCRRLASGEEYCSVEYDTHNHPEPTTSRGGQFTYYMSATPRKSWYLVVKGYFIHPPWGKHG